jgi:probable O-glycosylation ligase (exosortase A-associated)
MRDILIISVVLLSLPVGLVNPFYGSAIYAWVSYFYPHYFAWSFARVFPIAKLAALSTLGGMGIRSSSWSLSPVKQREVLLMLSLLVWFAVSSLFAFQTDVAWDKWQDMAKIVLMGTATAMLISNRDQLRTIFLVIALSIGFYGAKGGIFSIVGGGENMVMGPGGGISILGANNNFGLALNMALPFLWYLAYDFQSKWVRRLLRLTFFLSIPAVAFTYSRASFIALGFVLAAIVAKAKKTFLFLSAAIICFFIVYPFLPQDFVERFVPKKFVERQETITDYQADQSAMSRIDNWRFCWRLAMDRPLVGGGFQYNSKETFARYAPEFLNKYGGKTWDSHSIYFGILAAHGFPGFILFMSVIFTSIFSCRKIRRKTKNSPDNKWAVNYCHMIEVSFLALLVNGAFVNMEYFDLPYHLAGFVASMKVILAKSTLGPENEVQDSTALNPSAEEETG